MSEWASRIVAHPVRERLKALRAQIVAIELADDDPTEVLADLARLTAILDAIENRFSSADPLLLPPAPLSALDTHVQSATSEVSAFVSNGNRAHLTAANTQADAMLIYAIQLGLVAPGSSAEVVGILEGLRDRTERSFGALLHFEQELQAKLGKLEATSASTEKEITAQKARLDTAIAEHQQQFSTAEAARQQRSADALAADTTKLDQAFTDAQKRLQDSTQDISKRLEEMLVKSTSLASDQRAELAGAAKQVLLDLEEMRGKAENLLHVTGSTGMAGEYQKASSEARTTTRGWQRLAAMAMGGLVLFAILAFVAATESTGVEWGNVAARVFVALTFGILAAYAARQGDRYAEQESENRRYQLELSSIDPYLANLPKETQYKVKTELADKLFGNVTTHSSVTPVTGTGKDPLEMAFEVIKEFVKRR